MFNYSHKDKERPIIRGLYTINENKTLVKRLPKKINLSKINDSTYIAEDILFNGKIGLGIDTYDIQYQNLNNKNGVHRLNFLLTQFKDFPTVWIG